MRPEQKISNRVKKVIFLFVVLFILVGLTALAQKELELEYPEIGGFKPVTVETAIPDYVKYIFNFAIWIAGLVAFGALVYGGVRYLTSAGSPERLREAKKQILAAFLGIIILVSSYLILTTINPQLVILGTTKLAEVPTFPSPPPVSPPAPEVLVRMKEIARAVEGISSEIENLSDEVVVAMELCLCGESTPQCDCKGFSCQAVLCYGDPCPNREELEVIQREIIEKTDEISYYRERIIAEMGEDNKDIEPELKRLTEERAEELINKLEELIILIEEMISSSESMADLPNQCLPENCQPHCNCNEEKGGRCFCHITCGFDEEKDVMGCPPKNCTGDPCPSTKAIQEKIKELQEEISQTATNIIAIL
jgi:hypothetical protein